MNEDIEFLRDFLDCDRYRIAELIDSVPIVMRSIGSLLRQHAPGPFTVVYDGENDPTYELIQLLDGNNFEIKYGLTFGNLNAVKITPLYMETIEVTYISENEIHTNTYVTETYTQYATEYVPDIPEIRNPSRRGLRAKTLLIDDILFNEKLFDEFLKPPQRRKE